MNEETARLLGARIALLREKQGFSLGDLAERTGIAKSYISKLEKGESLNLGLTTLATLAAALGQTVHQLLPQQPNGEKSASDLTPSGESSVTFELISGSLPEPLQLFIEQKRVEGEPLPPETIQALSLLKHRGKHPETQQDYQFFYDLMRRLIK